MCVSSLPYSTDFIMYDDDDCPWLSCPLEGGGSGGGEGRNWRSNQIIYWKFKSN